MARELLLLDSAKVFTRHQILMQEAGYELIQATTYQEAKQLLANQNFSVGLANIATESFNLHLNELLQENHQTEWIALLSNNQLNNPAICQKLSGSIYDYHTFPIDIERLLITLGHAYGIADLNKLYLYSSENTLENDLTMVGTSKEMQHLFKNIRKVAGVDVPVLITGESGTGKELAARAIHERSNRAQGPFIAINCGALPTNLIQSELFGHEKGAFTGAIARKIGSLEAAHTGTVLLDEIGELPLELQVNLLRFLQEKTIRRVGDTIDRHVDVRVIAATNINLEEAVAAGRFREDLYYRIHVLTLQTPALRERGEDIELLAHYFFKKFSDEKNPRTKGFNQAALHLLRTYNWPGNVRELINRIHRALVMCESRLITPIDLGLERRLHDRQIISLEQAREDAEKKAIINALCHHHDNIVQAAASLGVSRITLYRLLKKHDLESE